MSERSSKPSFAVSRDLKNAKYHFIEAKIDKLTESSGISSVRRKFSWGVFHSVAYGGHLYLVCALCDATI